MQEYTSEGFNDPQDDVHSLQKKFRNAEADRRAYAEETTANIKKQRALLDQLKSENVALKDTIQKINNQQAKMSQTMAAKTATYEDIRNKYQPEIEKAKIEISQTTSNIDELRRKIKRNKQSLGGVNAGAENQNTLVKQIKILENRLDKANQKFNEAIALNKSLRQQIDSLRRERVIFDNLYKKLEKELHEKRKKMASIIESANSAYEERDKANDQIQSLKQQAKREAADFEKELKEISQIMEKNRKALDFVRLTEKQREDTQNTAEIEAEKQRKRNQTLMKQQNANNATLEKIQKYEEDLAKIQAATQITDFDKLVEFFKKNEEKNFTMFKYVNELSNEIESLEKAISDLKEEKSKYEGQGTQQDLIKKRALKDMEENLSKLEHRAENYEFQYHDASKVLTSVCNWIESLYNTLECSKIAPHDFATHSGVTESNLMAYLGIIEERANDIIGSYTTIMQGGHGTGDLNLDKDQSPSHKFKDEMPSFDEGSDEDGEGEKPLTIEEFTQKANEKVDMKKTQSTLKFGKKSYPSKYGRRK